MTPAQLAEIEARALAYALHVSSKHAMACAEDIPALIAEVKRLRALANEAINEAEHGWSYASEYFRGKYEVEKEIAGLRAALGDAQ